MINPYALDLAAQVVSDPERRDYVMQNAYQNRIEMPALYRAMHIIQSIVRGGGDPWALIHDMYIMDGHLNGYIRIDGQDPDFEEASRLFGQYHRMWG